MRIEKLLIIAFLSLCYTTRAICSTDTVPTKSNRAIQLEAEVVLGSINLKWQIPEELSCQSVKLLRSRNSEQYKEIVVLKGSENYFEDDNALFGAFNYRITCYSNTQEEVSESIQVETYLGSDYTHLNSTKKIKQGESVGIVFGHATKNEEVFISILNQNGDVITSNDHNLDNQSLVINTQNYLPGVYIIMAKLENYSFSIFKLEVHQ